MVRDLFKNVLVPHDFTVAADDALRLAASWATARGDMVTVLHVIAPFYPLRDLAYGPLVLDAPALEAQVLARLERHVAGVLGDGAAHCVVATGNPGHRIVAAAQGASCIVMPTTGRTGAAHALIGSVAERVVRLSPVPVLVLPSHRPRARRGASVRRRTPHGR
jgi:nucleotide-binding universal stress UspA family protein